MTDDQATRRASFRRWSLRRRLAVGATVLVLVTLLLAAAATVLSLRASLYDRLDQDVLVGLDVAAGPNGGAPGQNDGADDGNADGGDSLGVGPRQRVNSLEVVFDADGTATRSAYVSPEGRTVSLTPTQLETITQAIEGQADPVTVDLGGTLGDFRIISAERDGSTVVSGLSMRDTVATISSLIGILAIVLGVALLVAAGGIVWLVTVMLRPLRRVADTAERVAQRPLAVGEVSLPERVELSDDPGTEVGRVGAALDVLLSHVEASLASRQESEDRLRAFIADASHELRTPLASIRGYAQLAQDEEAAKTEIQARSLDRIEAEAARMGVLVDDLLLLARLDAGQPLREEPVDITLLAIETTDDAHAAHTDHEWRVEVDESVEVIGDEARLRQVLINLLGNAASHTPAGTTVTTSVTVEDDRVRVVIADDGPGIDEALLPRLFDRFARGDTARNRASGSTGLGLSIAAAIVHSHGGTIEASNGDRGAVFTVVLPVARPRG